jgi:hypothetical protein
MSGAEKILLLTTNVTPVYRLPRAKSEVHAKIAPDCPRLNVRHMSSRGGRVYCDSAQ